MAAIDYFKLYNLVSNSNDTSFVKENYPNFTGFPTGFENMGGSSEFDGGVGGGA